MAFNVKKQETHDLAREVADLAGESLAQAVDASLRERRDRLKRVGLAERLERMALDTASHFPSDFDSKAAFEALYDEQGLPK